MQQPGNLLQYLQQYQTFTAAQQSLITQAFETIACSDRQILLAAGHVCTRLFFVVEGVLRIASTNNKGIEVTHYFYKENMFCTMLQSFNEQQPSEAFIQACCNGKVLAITRPQLLKLYEAVPTLQTVIEHIHEQRMMEKVNLHNQQLGAAAIDIYRRFLQNQPDVALRVSQKDIAGYLGITPQSLSRLRRQLY